MRCDLHNEIFASAEEVWKVEFKFKLGARVMRGIVFTQRISDTSVREGTEEIVVDFRVRTQQVARDTTYK